MLTGTNLGKAIDDARKKKGVSKVDLARHFGVRPPSIQDWIRRGTISKEKLPGLWSFFADVCGPDHWGMTVFPTVIESSRDKGEPGPKQLAWSSSRLPIPPERGIERPMRSRTHAQEDLGVTEIVDALSELLDALPELARREAEDRLITLSRAPDSQKARDALKALLIRDKLEQSDGNTKRNLESLPANQYIWPTAKSNNE